MDLCKHIHRQFDKRQQNEVEKKKLKPNKNEKIEKKTQQKRIRWGEKKIGKRK